jgi:hypothetical protein
MNMFDTPKRIKEGRIDQTKPLNPERLAEEMKAALGGKFISMDTGMPQVGEDGKPDRNKPRQIVVRLTDEATETDQQAVESVIAAHDNGKLSAHEQRIQNRAAAFKRFTALDLSALRDNVGDKAQLESILGNLIDAMRDIQTIITPAEVE